MVVIPYYTDNTPTNEEIHSEIKHIWDAIKELQNRLEDVEWEVDNQ